MIWQGTTMTVFVVALQQLGISDKLQVCRWRDVGSISIIVTLPFNRKMSPLGVLFKVQGFKMCVSMHPRA